MNLLTSPISRTYYLLWNVVAWALILGLAFTIDLTKSTHVGQFWLPERVLVVALFIAVTFLALYRRLQNVGWSRWLAVLYVIPPIGVILGLVLLFVPSKTQNT
jgi:uncharacterized membrane protein YhaH (DUF805 family)